MLKALVVGLVVLLSAASMLTSASTAPVREDEIQIRALQTQQQDAWNRHDVKAYADLFTPDADVVNVVGWWWKGRPEIKSKLAAAHAFVFRNSTLTFTQVDVRFLTPQIAVVHAAWTMAGARTPPGMPAPTRGIQTQLVQKQNGKWLIAAFQNTNSIPEVPFPTGPPPSAPASGAGM